MKKLSLMIVVLALFGFAFHAFAASKDVKKKKAVTVSEATGSKKVISCSAVKSDEGESRSVADIAGESGKSKSSGNAGSTTSEKTK